MSELLPEDAHDLRNRAEELIRIKSDELIEQFPQFLRDRKQAWEKMGLSIAIEAVTAALRTQAPEAIDCGAGRHNFFSNLVCAKCGKVQP